MRQAAKTWQQLITFLHEPLQKDRPMRRNLPRELLRLRPCQRGSSGLHGEGSRPQWVAEGRHFFNAGRIGVDACRRGGHQFRNFAGHFVSPGRWTRIAHAQRGGKTRRLAECRRIRRQLSRCIWPPQDRADAEGGGGPASPRLVARPRGAGAGTRPRSVARTVDTSGRSSRQRRGPQRPCR